MPFADDRLGIICRGEGDHCRIGLLNETRNIGRRVSVFGNERADPDQVGGGRQTWELMCVFRRRGKASDRTM
jgi:hypothetical protein